MKKGQKNTCLRLSRTGYHGKVLCEGWGRRELKHTAVTQAWGPIQKWILFRQAVGWKRVGSSGVDIGTVTLSRTGRAHC